MKNLFKRVFVRIYFLILLLIPFVVFAQTDSGDETNWVGVIIGALIAVAEIVLRAIPNPKFTGIIGLVINLLKVVSDWLNNKGTQSTVKGLR